jgi:hypothetical protein
MNEFDQLRYSFDNILKELDDICKSIDDITDLENSIENSSASNSLNVCAVKNANAQSNERKSEPRYASFYYPSKLAYSSKLKAQNSKYMPQTKESAYFLERLNEQQRQQPKILNERIRKIQLNRDNKSQPILSTLRQSKLATNNNNNHHYNDKYELFKNSLNSAKLHSPRITGRLVERADTFNSLQTNLDYGVAKSDQNIETNGHHQQTSSGEPTTVIDDKLENVQAQSTLANKYSTDTYDNYYYIGTDVDNKCSASDAIASAEQTYLLKSETDKLLNLINSQIYSNEEHYSNISIGSRLNEKANNLDDQSGIATKLDEQLIESIMLPVTALASPSPSSSSTSSPSTSASLHLNENKINNNNNNNNSSTLQGSPSNNSSNAHSLSSASKGCSTPMQPPTFKNQPFLPTVSTITQTDLPVGNKQQRKTTREDHLNLFAQNETTDLKKRYEKIQQPNNGPFKKHRLPNEDSPSLINYIGSAQESLLNSTLFPNVTSTSEARTPTASQATNKIEEASSHEPNRIDCMTSLDQFSKSTMDDSNLNSKNLNNHKVDIDDKNQQHAIVLENSQSQPPSSNLRANKDSQMNGNNQKATYKLNETQSSEDYLNASEIAKIECFYSSMGCYVYVSRCVAELYEIKKEDEFDTIDQDPVNDYYNYMIKRREAQKNLAFTDNELIDQYDNEPLLDAYNASDRIDGLDEENGSNRNNVSTNLSENERHKDIAQQHESSQTASNINYMYIKSGVPVIVFNYGTSSKRRKNLRILLAERSTGFCMWDIEFDTVTEFDNTNKMIVLRLTLKKNYVDNHNQTNSISHSNANGSNEVSICNNNSNNNNNNNNSKMLRTRLHRQLTSLLGGGTRNGKKLGLRSSSLFSSASAKKQQKQKLNYHNEYFERYLNFKNRASNKKEYLLRFVIKRDCDEFCYKLTKIVADKSNSDLFYMNKSNLNLASPLENVKNMTNGLTVAPNNSNSMTTLSNLSLDKFSLNSLFFNLNINENEKSENSEINNNNNTNTSGTNENGNNSVSSLIICHFDLPIESKFTSRSYLYNKESKNWPSQMTVRYASSIKKNPTFNTIGGERLQQAFSLYAQTKPKKSNLIRKLSISSTQLPSSIQSNERLDSRYDHENYEIFKSNTSLTSELVNSYKIGDSSSVKKELDTYSTGDGDNLDWKETSNSRGDSLSLNSNLILYGKEYDDTNTKINAKNENSSNSNSISNSKNASCGEFKRFPSTAGKYKKLKKSEISSPVNFNHITHLDKPVAIGKRYKLNY